MVPKQCPFPRPTFWYLVCCATCLGSRDNSKYHTHIHTYIHDLTRISIDCLTPASRLRRSASVWTRTGNPVSHRPQSAHRWLRPALTLIISHTVKKWQTKVEKFFIQNTPPLPRICRGNRWSHGCLSGPRRDNKLVSMCALPVWT